MMFSIIIPAHNVAPYIGECVASLLRQPFADFEAFIVDDASTDGTLEVARAAAGDDPRFTFLSLPENQGQSAARNAALPQATGEYVLFLDADDLYAGHTLETLAARLQEHELDLLLFSAESFYENRRLHRERGEDLQRRPSVAGVMDGPELFTAMEAAGAFWPSACMLALRRSALEEGRLRFREGIIHEDLLFTLGTFPLAKRAEFLNEPLYRRRVREGSTMTKAFSMANVDGHFRVAQELRAWLDAHAADYDRAFVDAYTARIYETCVIPARYLFEITEAEEQAYRDGLSVADRIDYDLLIGQLHKNMRGIYDEVCGSRTYRLGRVFMALPSWAKSKFMVPRGK